MKKQLLYTGITMALAATMLLAPMTTEAAWQTSNGYWWNTNSSEIGYSIGWENINGQWYYFDNEGWMCTNQWIGDYYVTSDGSMAVNQWIGDYYVGNDGQWIPNYGNSQEGWKLNATGWWYQTSNGGYYANQWASIGGVWYYFDENGYMAADRWIGNYYVTSSGAMAVNQWIGNYYVGNDGQWISSAGYGQWIQDSYGWRFLKKDGAFVSNGIYDIKTSSQTNTYGFNNNGYMIANGWLQHENHWYYFQGDGILAKNSWIGNYYVDQYGVMVVNDWVGSYYLGSDGLWIPNYTFTLKETPYLINRDIPAGIITLAPSAGNTYGGYITGTYSQLSNNSYIQKNIKLITGNTKVTLTSGQYILAIDCTGKY
jgi:glucan-binding YG repeat protein